MVHGRELGFEPLTRLNVCSWSRACVSGAEGAAKAGAVLAKVQLSEIISDKITGEACSERSGQLAPAPASTEPREGKGT